MPGEGGKTKISPEGRTLQRIRNRTQAGDNPGSPVPAGLDPFAGGVPRNSSNYSQRSLRDWLTPLGSSAFRPGINNYLGDLILFVAPDLVHFRSLIQRDAVRDDVAGIDLSLFYAVQQGL